HARGGGRGPSLRPALARDAGRDDAPRGAARPPPVRALGRRAAAGRDRPRPSDAASGGVRRRADGRPRLDRRPGHPRAAAAGGRRVRADDRHGQPRSRRGGDRRRGPVPRRRPDRGITRAPDRRADPGPVEGPSMIALALRGLAARRLRSALTAVAVVLGVAMVAGTFVLTDQIRNAFDAIQSQAVEGLDVVVGPKEAFQAGFTEPATLRESLVSRVERVPGVAAAHGFVTTSGQVIVDGKALDTGGAPSLVVGYAPEPFNPTRLLEGREPLRRGEAAVLQQTAERAGLGVGDELRLATDRGVRRLRVSGIIAFGSGGSSLGGATLVVAPQRQVQRWFGMRGR